MWRPVDYFVKGTLCPVHDVEQMARRLADELQAPLLIFLACDPDAILRSLTFLCSDSRQDEQDFNAVIQATNFVNTEKEINSLVTSLAFRSAFQSDAEELLKEKLERLIAPAVAPRIAKSVRKLSVLPLETTEGYVLVRPLVLVGKAALANRHKLSQADTDLLLAMLNATPPARLRFDAKVMSDVGDRLDPQITADGAVDFAEMARRGSDLAVKVTRSDRAGVFLRQPEAPDFLELRADASAEGSPAGTEQLIQEADADSFAKLVVDRHRARQSATDDITRCGTPIPGPLGSPRTPAIGVLLIVRDGSRDFAAYDLALARNICLRLAILHSTAAAGSIAKAIADFRNPSLLAPPIQATNAARKLDDLPPDIQIALAKVPATLEHVVRSTNSHVASLRLALPDPNAPEPHGLALMRVAVFPAARIDDPYPVQGQKDGGLNWRTVLEGRPTYAPDVAVEPEFLGTHEGTQSELSVPIRVEGRLVGVLNLESHALNNYGAFLPHIQALAGAIGRAFADAAAQLSQPVLERAAEILDTGHRHSHELDGLEDRTKQLKLDRKSLTAIRKYIKDSRELLASIMREDSEPKGRVPSTTLGEVLAEACAEELPLLTLPDRRQTPELHYRLRGDEARLLLAATADITSNLTNHGGKPGVAHSDTGGPLHALTLGSCSWDGRRYAAINFYNSSPDFLPRSEMLQIYRIPFPRGDGRLRLGAYLAGIRLRQIGGMIHFSIAEQSQRARTVVMVPNTDQDQ
jgi:GAF domain-containing protein